MRTNTTGRNAKVQTQISTLKPATSLTRIQTQNKLALLNGKIDDAELWTLRRVFRVLNTYCPQNEKDLHLIETLENEIVNDFLRHE